MYHERHCESRTCKRQIFFYGRRETSEVEVAWKSRLAADKYREGVPSTSTNECRHYGDTVHPLHTLPRLTYVPCVSQFKYRPANVRYITLSARTRLTVSKKIANHRRGAKDAQRDGNLAGRIFVSRSAARVSSSTRGCIVVSRRIAEERENGAPRRRRGRGR